MQRRVIIGLYLALAIGPLPAVAQGLGEFTGLHAGAAGMGAGLAASQHNGALVRNTYGAAVRVQESIVAQNQAVEQFLALGISYEAKKQWVNAEDAFTSALKWICNRDGPGSPASVPALQHLAKVSKCQNKLDQAIGYQKTVVAFAHRARVPDTKALLGADRFLSDMYVQKGDYADAEPVLKEAVALLDKTPLVTLEEHTATLKVYGRVLRELNKTSEADAIDASLATNVKPADAAAAVSPAGTAPIGATGTTMTGTAPFVFPAAPPVAVSAPSQAVAPAASTVATQASTPVASPVSSHAATHASARPASSVAVPEATQASAPSNAPSAPLISPAPPPQASSNAAPADQVPAPATTVTSTTTSLSEPAVKADQAAAPVDDKPKDESAPGQMPSATTNEKPGDKTTSPEVEQNAAATTGEKPAQPPSEQPAPSESRVQSQSSDQSTKQADKAN